MSLGEQFLLIFLIGILAHLVNGMLGMGYKVTSSIFLMSLGIHPAIASASVHIAGIIPSLLSGLSHMQLGNVRHEIWLPLALLGSVGAFCGALGLINLPLGPMRLIVGLVLLAMSGIILYRFIQPSLKIRSGLLRIKGMSPTQKLGALGFVAGFFDSLGGGGWGPICTPSLMIAGTLPRITVGSVNLAEFFVTVATTLTFMLFIRVEEFNWVIVLALALSGIGMAPLAAWLSNRLSPRILGGLVGVLIMMLSARMVLLALSS